MRSSGPALVDDDKVALPVKDLNEKLNVPSRFGCSLPRSTRQEKDWIGRGLCTASFNHGDVEIDDPPALGGAVLIHRQIAALGIPASDVAGVLID